MDLIGLLVMLVIICLVVWCARAIMAAFGIGDPIATLVYVAIVLVVVLWLAQSFGYIGGHRLLVR